MERASVGYSLVLAAIATLAIMLFSDRAPEPDAHCWLPVNSRYAELERLATIGRTAALASERFEALIGARMIDGELGGTRERELDEALRFVALAAAADYDVLGDSEAASFALSIGGHQLSGELSPAARNAAQ